MAELPTNYLDDILAASMGGKRIFKITHSDGTTEEVTIEDVSEYEQVGSNFGAGDINNTNAEVNKKFDSGDVVDPMETTEPGFAADAYQTKLQFDEQNKNKADKSEITALNGALEWKYLGEYSLNSKATLPTNWKELYMVAYENTSDPFSFFIPRIHVTKVSECTLANGHYDNTGWYYYCNVAVTSTQAWLKSYHRCGSTQGSPKTKIYYR